MKERPCTKRVGPYSIVFLITDQVPNNHPRHKILGFNLKFKLPTPWGVELRKPKRDVIKNTGVRLKRGSGLSLSGVWTLTFKTKLA